jgi:transcriptional regulator with XRE-family HTH domain
MSHRNEAVVLRFADNLCSLRRQAGRSQENLGMMAGLNRTEVGLIERGKREPRLLTLIKLAAALEVSMGVLCQGIDWQVVASPATGSLLIDGRLTE